MANISQTYEKLRGLSQGKIINYNENGLTVASANEVRELIFDGFRMIFGDTINLDDNSFNNQISSIVADQLTDLSEAIEQIFDGLILEYSYGPLLDGIGSLNGLQRKQAAKSTIAVLITSKTGAIIPIHSKITNNLNNKYFENLTEIVVPAGQDVTFQFYCTEYGAITAQDGEINKIATPVYGWDSAVNEGDGVTGALRETDAEFRLRIENGGASGGRKGSNSLIAIYRSVAEVEGVKDLEVFENNTEKYDKYGMPRQYLHVVVEGGQNLEIAKAIADGTQGSVAAGIGLIGSLSFDYVVDISNTSGLSKTITKNVRFSRPALLNCFVSIIITKLNTYSSNDDILIRDSIQNYINSLKIGAPVFASDLVCLVNSVTNNANCTDAKVGIVSPPLLEAIYPAQYQKLNITTASIGIYGS